MTVKSAVLISIACAGAALTAVPALAACPANPIKHDWAVETGDQRVSGDFVRSTVFGKKVRFDNSYEHYMKNGDYVFFDGNNKYEPGGYRFYTDGSRCLEYDTPRHDLYVVRDKKLVLINRRGTRFVARITQR